LQLRLNDKVLEFLSPSREKETQAVMTELEVGALLDAHDALVKACIDSVLTFPEFLLGYGDFPNNYALDAQKAPEDARAVLRLFRKRLAFHFQVAGILSGFRAEDDTASLYGDPGRFISTIGPLRLRALVARYPDFKAEPNF
jgi:hypothetical protein